MLRDQAAVLLIRQNLLARSRQLGAEDLGEHAADEEHDEREDDVLNTDDFVIGIELEVIAPRVGSVLGMIVGIELATLHPRKPVVEATDTDDETNAARDVGDRQQCAFLQHRCHTEDRPRGDGDQDRERSEGGGDPEAACERWF